MCVICAVLCMVCMDGKTLSETEADFIIKLAEPRIKRSLAGDMGGLVSDTRTSHNTWLPRNHFILETIYRRAANILNISESLLHPGWFCLVLFGFVWICFVLF